MEKKRQLTREGVLALIQSPVRIETNFGPPIEFAILSVSDVEDMRDRLNLGRIDFAVETVAQQSRGEMPPSSARALPRPTLLRICREWAAQTSTFGAERAQVRSFSDFKRLAQAKIEEWDREVRGVGERLSRSFSSGIQRVFTPVILSKEIDQFTLTSESVKQFASSLSEAVESVVRKVRSALSDVETALQEAQEGKSHLDNFGYGFATRSWGISVLRRIARQRPGSQDLHRAFLDLTRDGEFGEQLTSRVAGSKKLARRAGILRAAYAAHLRREYALSIPVLYAQLEGVLTDLLILEGLARQRGRKALKTRGSGELVGLRSKAKEYGLRPAMVREFLTGEILEELSPDRNGVLHGSITYYRQASRSARLLLMIDVLSAEVYELERTGSRDPKSSRDHR